MKWKDKRDIYMLSTVHGCTIVDSGVVDRKTGAAIQKSECILHYNKHMSGVDRNDQLSKYYSFARKVMKIWKKKQFFYLLNSMVLQSFIVYLKYSLDQPKLSHYDFRLTLVHELVTSSRATDYLPRHEQRRSSSVATRYSPTASYRPSFPFLHPTHCQQRTPKKEMCGLLLQKTRKETVYWCKDCQVALCVVPCFGSFHNSQVEFRVKMEMLYRLFLMVDMSKQRS